MSDNARHFAIDTHRSIGACPHADGRVILAFWADDLTSRTAIMTKESDPG